MNICSSNVPLLQGFGLVKGSQLSRQAQFFGLRYRGGGEVTRQIGGKDSRFYGPYGCTVMR